MLRQSCLGEKPAGLLSSCGTACDIRARLSFVCPRPAACAPCSDSPALAKSPQDFSLRAELRVARTPLAGGYPSE